MVNFFAVYKFILRGVMKLVGMKPQTVEIEPGTVMNFWVPTKIPEKSGKPAVVFLHAFGGDGIIIWQFQVIALAKHYAVYVPDFVFFGGSTTERSDRSPEFQAECVAKGLRKLGVERGTFVGLSYGGMVGFKMAEMYPNLVEAMVVSCSVMSLTKSFSNAAFERLGFKCWSDYLLPDSVNGLRNMFQFSFYKFPHLPDWICKHFLEAMFDNRTEREELLEALVVDDERFTIPNYTQRVYLLWGENDQIFNMEIATNLKEQLGDNATLESIEKAGLLLNWSSPLLTTGSSRKFSLLFMFEDVENYISME